MRTKHLLIQILANQMVMLDALIDENIEPTLRDRITIRRDQSVEIIGNFAVKQAIQKVQGIQ